MAQEPESPQPPRDATSEGAPTHPADAGTSIEEPRPRKRRWSWTSRLLAVLATIVLVAGGVFGWRYLSSYESTDDAQVDAHLNPVSARIRGHVVRVNVDDNQYVKKGTILVEI